MTNQSEDVKDLVAALIKAQSLMDHARKDSNNPHFNNRYASLESVIDATKKPLADQGLVVIQTMDIFDHGLTLITTLAHASGQWTRSFTPVMNEKKNAQGMGSGLTYARRYALSAIVGLGQDDDDGNDASQPPHKAPRAAPAAPKPSGTPQIVIAKEKARPKPPAGRSRDSIKTLIEERKWKPSDVRAVLQEYFHQETISDLTDEQFDELGRIIYRETAEAALSVIRATNKALAARNEAPPGLEASAYMNEQWPHFEGEGPGKK